jgi:hypothetical protein
MGDESRESEEAYSENLFYGPSFQWELVCDEYLR